MALTRNQTVISKDTLIPLGLALLMLAGVWSVAKYMNGINTQLKDIRSELWTDRCMIRWAQELEHKNPTLQVPNVFAIHDAEMRQGNDSSN